MIGLADRGRSRLRNKPTTEQGAVNSTERYDHGTSVSAITRMGQCSAMTPDEDGVGAVILFAMESLGRLSTGELVARYARAAKRHGEATASGDRPANTEADLIAAVYRELRTRESQAALLDLLDNEDPGVRAWAGAHALGFAPERGEPTLADLAESPGLLGFGAEMTLREWRAGRLQFP